jgi:hypothetical protein
MKDYNYLTTHLGDDKVSNPENTNPDFVKGKHCDYCHEAGEINEYEITDPSGFGDLYLCMECYHGTYRVDNPGYKGDWQN